MCSILWEGWGPGKLLRYMLLGGSCRELEFNQAGGKEARTGAEVALGCPLQQRAGGGLHCWGEMAMLLGL